MILKQHLMLINEKENIIRVYRTSLAFCAVPSLSVGLRVCGFAGLRVCGFAGLRVCGFAGLRVCGFAGLRVCGFAGLRERKKHSWKNSAEHDGGMPRGGKEAACGGFRYIHRSDGKTSRNTREDVGLKDNSKQAESVEKISGLGKGKGETSKRKLGCSVRDGDRCGSAGASLLCKESICSDGENRNRKRTSVELSCSTEGERSGNTTRTGNANDKFRRPVHLCKSVRDHYRLVPHAEGKEGKPLLAKLR